jgi:hypothetical protein
MAAMDLHGTITGYGSVRRESQLLASQLAVQALQAVRSGDLKLLQSIRELPDLQKIFLELRVYDLLFRTQSDLLEFASARIDGLSVVLSQAIDLIRVAYDPNDINYYLVGNIRASLHKTIENMDSVLFKKEPENLLEYVETTIDSFVELRGEDKLPYVIDFLKEVAQFKLDWGVPSKAHCKSILGATLLLSFQIFFRVYRSPSLWQARPRIPSLRSSSNHAADTGVLPTTKTKRKRGLGSEARIECKPK